MDLFKTQSEVGFMYGDGVGVERNYVEAVKWFRLTDILGSPDDMKFRSRMTLFDAVSKQEIFAEAIAAFYRDGKDRATLDIL